MDAVFVKTANPVQSRCLGAPLLPLSIGHLFLLRKYCPDVLTLEDIELGSLAVASFICAHPHGKVEMLLRRRTAALTFRIWGLFSTRWDLAAERDRFDHYLHTNLEPPKLWHDLSDPLLMTELHYSERDARNLSVVEANAFWATLGELRGKFNFEDDRTKGFFEYARKMDEQRRGQRSAVRGQPEKTDSDHSGLTSDL
jgi:hypothetical protein